MTSTIVFVGAGSAALHHVMACDVLGVNVALLEQRTGHTQVLLERFRQRYGADPKISVLSLEEYPLSWKFDAGIVATPATSHVDGVAVLAPLVAGPIYIEKPAWLGGLSQEIASCCLVTGSQNVFREIFGTMRVLLKKFPEPISGELCYFESRKNICAAHPWNPGYEDGWSSSDSSGGGVHFELSHAFYWLANLLSLDLSDCEWKVLDIARQETPSGEFRTEACRVSVSSSRANVLVNLGSDEALEFAHRGGRFYSQGSSLSFDLGVTEDTLAWSSSAGTPPAINSFRASRSTEALALIRDLLAYDPSCSQLLPFTRSLEIDAILETIQSTLATRHT